MNKKKYFLSLIILFFLLILAFFIYKNNLKENLNINYLKINEKIIKVQVLSSPQEQALGLSHKKSISEDEGMLFVFKNEGRYAFWMKDMNFPIDIIYFDKENRIVFLEKNVSPDTFPKTFTSDQDAQYVLEVKAGFIYLNNLKVGDFFEFLP